MFWGESQQVSPIMTLDSGLAPGLVECDSGLVECEKGSRQ